MTRPARQHHPPNRLQSREPCSLRDLGSCRGPDRVMADCGEGFLVGGDRGGVFAAQGAEAEHRKLPGPRSTVPGRDGPITAKQQVSGPHHGARPRAPRHPENSRHLARWTGRRAMRPLPATRRPHCGQRWNASRALSTPGRLPFAPNSLIGPSGPRTRPLPPTSSPHCRQSWNRSWGLSHFHTVNPCHGPARTRRLGNLNKCAWHGDRPGDASG